MKNVWAWALMVCLFSSACKRKVEKELPVADTLSVVAEPVRPAEPPLKLFYLLCYMYDDPLFLYAL